MAFYGPRYLDQHFVSSLAWTPDEDGLSYAVRKRVAENSPVVSNDVMHASLAGNVTVTAVIEGSFGIPREHSTLFHVTKDRKYVLISVYAPLIWDVAAARPRVTPYDVLVPSSRSGRYLGVEIDTRQLVLVDEHFQIAKRCNVFFPIERRVDIAWSADERFAVCRTYGPYPLDLADGFRIDLHTGKQTPLGKCHAEDQFIFSGDGGEVLHLRVAAASDRRYWHGANGARITVHEGAGGRRHLLTTGRVRMPKRLQDGTAFPPVIAAPDGVYVAAAVPRPDDQPPGAHYHLVSRNGQVKPFLPLRDDRYITPYYPIAFAGDRLIARSGSTLFSIPISQVAEYREAGDEQ
jgi:hypothetical protein